MNNKHLRLSGGEVRRQPLAMRLTTHDTQPVLLRLHLPPETWRRARAGEQWHGEKMTREIRTERGSLPFVQTWLTKVNTTSFLRSFAFLSKTLFICDPLVLTQGSLQYMCVFEENPTSVCSNTVTLTLVLAVVVIWPHFVSEDMRRLSAEGDYVYDLLWDKPEWPAPVTCSWYTQYLQCACVRYANSSFIAQKGSMACHEEMSHNAVMDKWLERQSGSKMILKCS